MTASIRPPLAALCLALLAIGCGGGGGGPTDPTPTFTTLTLDFSYVQVIEDCDGVEGDGDFHFTVSVSPPGIGPSEVVYRESPTFGPGAKSDVIGRRTYRIESTADAAVQVSFLASEVDKSIFGAVYNDERLDEAYSYVYHSYDQATGTWSNLGPQSITLGSSGCRVVLYWTATAS